MPYANSCSTISHAARLNGFRKMAADYIAQVSIPYLSIRCRCHLSEKVLVMNYYCAAVISDTSSDIRKVTIDFWFNKEEEIFMLTPTTFLALADILQNITPEYYDSGVIVVLKPSRPSKVWLEGVKRVAEFQ